MNITIEPLENKFIIKEIELKDIENMIRLLSQMKTEIHKNMEILDTIHKNHIPSEAEKAGAVGYHPREAYIKTKKEIACQNIWKDKELVFESVECSRELCNKELRTKQYGKISINFKEDDKLLKREIYLKSEKSPDNIEITHNYVLKETVTEVVPNLFKAKEQITQMYLDDSSDLIGANVDWQPCGGTYVAKAINRFFLVEVNVDGLAIKEISSNFYDSFVKEFS